MNQGIHFCGCPESLFGRGRRVRKWEKRHLLWCILDWLPSIERPVQVLTFRQSFAAWSAVCGLTFEQTTDADAADFLILTREIDGKNGTLAYQELPHNDYPVHGYYDSQDTWGTVQPPTAEKIDLGTVAKHEIGHGLGVPHTNVPNSLMNPTYNPKINEPQEWEINFAVDLYGPSIVQPTPVPTPEADYPVEVKMFSGTVFSVIKQSESWSGT